MLSNIFASKLKSVMMVWYIAAFLQEDLELERTLRVEAQPLAQDAHRLAATELAFSLCYGGEGVCSSQTLSTSSTHTVQRGENAAGTTGGRCIAGRHADLPPGAPNVSYSMQVTRGGRGGWGRDAEQGPLSRLSVPKKRYETCLPPYFPRVLFQDFFLNSSAVWYHRSSRCHHCCTVL
jgi:hypothetical protein